MDANRLLLVLLALSALVFLITAIRFRFRGLRPQLLGVIGILAATALVYFVWPDDAGFFGASLWGAFFIAPTLAMRWVQQLSMQRRYARASWLAGFMRWMQPWGGWSSVAATFDALELARNGRTDEAVAALQKMHAAGPMAASARAEIARVTGQWAEFLVWIGSLPRADRLRHPELVPTTLRALGESGETSAVVATYVQFEPVLARPMYQAQLRMARLMVLVFCGRVRSVERFCETFLRDAPLVNRRFWIARARLAAGDELEARRELQAIADDATDVDSRVGAVRVLAAEPRAPFEPDATDIAILDRIEVDLEHILRYGGVVSASSRRPWATWLLIGANLAVFATEILLGGAESPSVLIDLGAVVPVAVQAGEWWRLGAALFLHFGVLHVLMNMLGLVVLGPFLERAVGWVRFTVVYVAAGLLSMYCAEIVAMWQGRENEFVVGASGAIMALVGGTAAWMLEGWRRERAWVARARLLSMVAIVVMQAVFDWLIPEVSFTAHFSGAVSGFVLMWLLLVLPSRARSHGPPPGRLQAA